jgi:hypothetical protein
VAGEVAGALVGARAAGETGAGAADAAAVAGEIEVSRGTWSSLGHVCLDVHSLLT